MKKMLIALIILAFGAGCTTVEFMNTQIKVMKKSERMFLTTGDGTTRHKPIGLLRVKHTGIMLFGLIPISPGYLEDVSVEFRKAARLASNEANAVINIEFETTRPPFPLCLIWWVSTSSLKGEIVYIKDLDKLPGKPDKAKP